MKTAHILLLCILGAMLLSPVICNNGIGPNDCCFEFYPRRLNKKVFSSYRITDHRCAVKSAVILKTKGGREICANQSLSWVTNIMKSLDESL